MHLGAIVFMYALSLYSARRVVVQECADFVPDVVPSKDCGSKRFYALHVQIYRAPASHNEIRDGICVRDERFEWKLGVYVRG